MGYVVSLEWEKAWEREYCNYLFALLHFLLGSVSPIDTQSIILIFNECERWSCNTSIVNDSMMEMDLVQDFSDPQMSPELRTMRLTHKRIIFDVNMFSECNRQTNMSMNFILIPQRFQLALVIRMIQTTMSLRRKGS